MNHQPPSLNSAGRWQVLCASIVAFLAVVPGLLADTSSLQLASSAQVDGSGIFLQQIVKSDGSLPSVRLADAPAFGKTTDFTRAQITALLAKTAPEFTATNWTGANSVEVSRRDHTLTEAAALDLLTSTLQKNYVKDK